MESTHTTNRRLFSVISVPMRLISEANNRDHWRIKNKRKQKQQNQVALEWLLMRPDITIPCEVHLIYYHKKLMDIDNFIISCKAVRDQIADCLIPGLAKGRADDDPRITWHYEQKIAKSYLLEIKIYV
jgi:hypothetical protein